MKRKEKFLSLSPVAGRALATAMHEIRKDMNFCYKHFEFHPESIYKFFSFITKLILNRINFNDFSSNLEIIPSKIIFKNDLNAETTDEK